MKFPPKQTILVVFAVLYMALATFAAVRFYDLYRTYESRVPVTDKEAEKEAAILVTQLKKIMEVPDEKPVIATVKDRNSLAQEQAFFAQAENGDKLIVFEQARKAILFRPSVGRIVESGPLVVSPGPQQTTPVRVAVYNGTTQAGLATEVEQNLKQAAGAAVTTTTGDATVKTYTETLVVDLTGEMEATAEEIAKFLNAQVGQLPEGESTPDADILVLVGSE